VTSMDLLFPLAATFATTIAVMLFLRSVVIGRPHPVRERLRKLVEEGGGGMAHISAARADGDDDWLRVLRPLSKLAKDSAESTGRLRDRLSWAGLRGPHAVETYLAIKLVLAFSFGGAVLLADALGNISFKSMFAALVIATAIGFYTPTLWLRSRIGARQRTISRTLPDALDLLLSCVEAGLSLEAAVERVARELSGAATVLSQELSLAMKEIEAGLSRSDAFRRLAQRTGVKELRSLAAIFVQTEMFGTSIGKALRVLSESLRVQRMHRAAERAATVAVRLTIPLIFCLLPALMTVVMGGAVVRMIGIVFPTLKAAGNG
jgi:tight adherence protein C